VDGRLVLDDLGRELIGLGPGLRDLIGSSQRALEPCALLRELRLLLAQGIGGRLLRLPRGVEVGRGLVVRRHRGVPLPARHRTGLHKTLVALHVGCRAGRLGLSRDDLRPRLLEATARAVDLALRGRHRGLGLLDAGAGRSLDDTGVHERRLVLLHRRRQVRGGLRQARLEISRVQLHEQIASLHVRVVVHEHAGDVARYLGAHPDDMTIDERVVCGLVRSRVQDVADAEGEQHHGRDNAERQDDPASIPASRSRCSR